MQIDTDTYTFIEDFQQLKEFADLHKSVKWLCFDTEFMGEKRFVTLLCLVQIASEHGYYLIDPIKIKDLSPLIQLIEDEHITKITHAGENDFRLFNILFNTLPKNVFDTQIAAGFVGYKYPVSFQKLLESELDVRVGKGYTVTDWSKRPFDEKQIKYALNDVIYLYDLWQSLVRQLRELGRQMWVVEECQAIESPKYYEQSPYKEAFNSNLIQSLQPKQQLFLIRLYAWRTEEARKRNYSREMILPSKLIGTIIRAAGGGLGALKSNRRLPEKTMSRHGQTFVDLYNQEPTKEELAVLKEIPKIKSTHPQQDIINEMLHLLIQYKCFDENLSINLAMPRAMLNKLKADKNYFEDALENGWRKEFLGEEIITWLKFRNDLKLVFGQGKFELTLK